jgi:hypothetical protein
MQNGPRAVSTRAAGGTVGIDQEVVTLRGLFGNSGSRHDVMPGGYRNPNSPVVCGLSLPDEHSSQEAPLRATALSRSHLTWSFGTTAI